MIGLIFFLNYMVSKRPIYSLLCNISFIEYFLRGDISNFSFKFGETSLELEKPPVPERRALSTCRQDFLSLGAGKRAGGSVRVFLVLMMPLF